jgi:hypothetical protein
MNRRTFLKVSGVSALVLGVGAFAAQQFAPRLPTSQLKTALIEDSRVALRAIVPAILGPVFSGDEAAVRTNIEATINRVDAAILGLSASAQKEVAELFLLLNTKPLRWAMTGIGDWKSAGENEVAAFLQKWRTHRLPLLQVAYHALHDLIGGSYYADASTWKAIGFALPPSFQST